MTPAFQAMYLWCGRRTWTQRVIGALVGTLGLLLLTPTRPVGACGVGDIGCGVDQAMYNSMLLAARLLWMLNRLLLLVAYLLDIIRFEIIANLFLGPYAQLTSLVGTAIVPVAMLAMLVAMLVILLSPLTGMPSPFNIRQIFVIVLIAPTLLVSLGTLLGDTEKLRVDLADYLYAAAAQGGAGFVGGVAPASGDMPAPAFMYPTTCDTVLLPRRTGGLEADRVYRPDELAAAYLYASAADIHCDFASGSQIAGLPAQWANDVPGYAHADDIGDQDVSDRQQWKDSLTDGLIRLFLGLFVSFLALVYYAAHLVFTLALVALWVSIPFGVIFGMFKKDFGWVGDYCRNAFDILKNSWITSFIIGLLTAGLIAASQSGNANVFAGIATGTLVFLIFTFFNALATLKGALSALTAIAGTAMGGVAGGAQAMSGAMRMAGGAAMGLATGGASTVMGAASGVAGGAAQVGRMATTGMSAARESGSAAFGMAAAAGRNDMVMRAGEAARAAGLLRGPGGDAFVDAMRTGNAKNQSAKAYNQRMKSSGRTAEVLKQEGEQRAERAKAETTARAERKQDRRQRNQIDQLRDGNVAQRGVAAAQALPGAAKGAWNAATSDDPIFAGIGAVQAGSKAVADAGKAAAGVAAALPEAAVGAGKAAVGAGKAAVTSAKRSVDPNDRFASAWRMNEQGQFRRVDDEDAATPPEDARRGNFSNEEILEQTRAGATVRFHEDRTASLWTPAAPDAAQAAPDAAPTPDVNDTPDGAADPAAPRTDTAAADGADAGRQHLRVRTDGNTRVRIHVREPDAGAAPPAGAAPTPPPAEGSGAAAPAGVAAVGAAPAAPAAAQAAPAAPAAPAAAQAAPAAPAAAQAAPDGQAAAQAAPAAPAAAQAAPDGQAAAQAAPDGQANVPPRSIPDTTLDAMRSRRSARTPRQRPRPTPPTPSPADYFSDDDPSKHFA